MSNEKLFAEFPPVSTPEWKAVIEKDLKGADYEKKLVWNTAEGFKVNPFYRAEDLEDKTYLQTAPDAFPFVRGNKADNNNWEIRQDICAKTAAEANTIALDAIKRGAEGIGFCMKHVGDDQLDTMLKGIDLNKTKIHFRGSKSYTKLMENLVAYLTKNNINPAIVEGSICFDPMSYALKHGEFYGSIETNIEEAKALFQNYAAKMPKFKLLAINAHIIHNAGAGIVQEMGYGLSWANEFVYLLTQAGIAVDDIARHLFFHVATGSNYFMEIAKIRAMRMLWANIIKQYKPANDESTKTFIHASTSKWNKSVFDPYVNMLRTTTETMSSAIGGADSISVEGFDAAYEKSDDFANRIARNQQILLKEESYMDKVADPAAGSYYIENLTDSLAQHAWALFTKVEEKGGFVEAYKAGMIQDDVAASAKERDNDIATRKIIMLGTNQYPNILEKMNDKISKESCSCDAKQGAYKTIKPYRLSQIFDDLRLKVEKAAKRPQVFLLTHGNLNMRKARAGFAQNFFGCAGYEILDNAGFATPAEGADAAVKSKAEIVVLCGSDEEYAEWAPVACAELKAKGFKGNITLAGYPKDAMDALKAAGVQEFVHVKTNLIDALTKYNQELNIN